MSYEPKLERILDAPPELLFDTIVDPEFADDIFGDQVEGGTARRFDIDDAFPTGATGWLEAIQRVADRRAREEGRG